MPWAEGSGDVFRKAHEGVNEMNDLKVLMERPECCWGYIDELRMDLAATCKERDEARKQLHEAKSELAKYREAEQDGRMAVLPVKKGTKIFRVVDIPEHKCQGRMRGHYFPSTKRIYKGVMQWEDGSDFGKTVFLTREEAEAALKGGEEHRENRPD